ncbi:pogo transposable element with ZNF domain [Leuresthes tenuis]|uniref:pogo transposable element with ZNF domain n=1 Tax=Leuresthes tenuis TaxID=355514 RepID=UPI003B510D7E
MMTEVKTTAGGGADLLMECEEEELERLDGDLQSSVSVMEVEEERDPVPVRIIPIPVQPLTSSSFPTATSTVKSVGSPLGFTINGRPVPLLPGGGGAELRLCSHPEGSASGFTTVQIPVTLTVHSPVGTRYINTVASLTAAVSSSTALTPPLAAPAPLPKPDHIPIITGVVSGEAAQKVLNDHNVNFKSSPLTPLKTTSFALASPQKTKSRQTSPHKPLRKGALESVSPPNCLVCTSQYKLITELRGFMCLCSPDIALSLRNLKKPTKKHSRRSRDKNKSPKTCRDPQSSSKVSKSRPGHSAAKVITPPRKMRRYSDDFQSDEFSSPISSSNTIGLTQQHQSGPPSDLPQGKLVILVEDFYYGCDPGRSAVKHRQRVGNNSGPYPCIHCSKTLSNNIKLMNHMQEHASMVSQHAGGIDSASSCPHCFRHFLSPIKLQCHLEAVHSKYESTVTCKICELAFDNEPAFLCHMRTTHKPGEMPYFCQVCDFRSSFYSDVWSHFKQAHADTRHLLCQFCLRVLRSYTCYQQHFARHLKKHVLSCDKCRLHFLYCKERTEHKALYHKTHITPPQLSGLKAGTKVTVRTYSAAGKSEREGGQKKTVAPCKVVDVVPPSPTEEAPKRKPVESLGSLLSRLSADSGSCPSQHCIECLSSIPDLKIHFPSLVHCSLCRFVTCCSTSYANHMINNHATCSKVSQFPTIFKSNPRLPQTIRCQSCTFSTCRGDTMAVHLTENTEHAFAVSSAGEWTVSGAETQNSGQNGAFVPIHLVPSGQTSTRLSVKSLPYPSPVSFTPAMTIKILGTQPQSGQPTLTPLTLSQLSVVLSSLCHGISQTSRQHQTSPATIRSWIAQQQRRLSDKKWFWRTDKMAEWVLNQREQQLSVDADVLLLIARQTLGESSQVERHSWIVDFMLRHDLGLQTGNGNRLRSIQDNSRLFTQTLCSQMQSQDVPPHGLGCMDELPIFINSDQFANQNPQAFKLLGSPGDRSVFDVILSALSDGSFLPPLLFFTGTSSLVPDGFPDNVLLEARQEGFTDEERLQIWIDKVWCMTSKNDHNSLLVMDVYRGHLSDKFRESLSSVKTDVAFIPSGCSCRLQPLDICVTQVLRDFLQARWTQLVSDGGLDGLGLDQLALTLACWLSEVSSTLNSQTHILHRSFGLACSLQPGEGHGEKARMIAALNKALTQPLETGGPVLVPTPGS